jgi:non-heme chloroperoxidase
MKQVLYALTLVFLFAVSLLQAQDFTGSWQTTIGNKKEHHRLILKVQKDPDGDLAATFYLIDDSPDEFPVHPLTQQGAELAFTVPQFEISYKGTLSADGKTIAGTMNWDGKGSVTFTRATPETAWPHDVHCTCRISFVPVDKGVKLEVLDWGGTGRPLILLAGLGDTAHVFDGFAGKLAAHYHVYGITRRGFGDSTQPPPTEANYNANRLGDDVVAVIDALHLAERPVLAGHSIAGEELSSVGARHPDKVAGLIYLDAGYEYACYDHSLQSINLDMMEIRTELEHLILEDSDSAKTMSDLLAKLPEFEKELAARQEQIAGLRDDPIGPAGEFGPAEAMLLGEQKYVDIKVPALAIFANPHKLEPMPGYDDAQRATLVRSLSEHTTNFVHVFQTDVPGAQVISIPNADHYVFQSNEAEVLKDMDQFIGGLPKVH